MIIIFLISALVIFILLLISIYTFNKLKNKMIKEDYKTEKEIFNDEWYEK